MRRGRSGVSAGTLVPGLAGTGLGGTDALLTTVNRMTVPSVLGSGADRPAGTADAVFRRTICVPTGMFEKSTRKSTRSVTPIWNSVTVWAVFL